MGKRKLVIVGNLRFGTKLAAKEWVRNLVARYPDGAVLNQDDTVFLKDLLELHPRVDEKVGSGVHSFIIDTNWEYSNTRTIFINRTDGSRTDFSWVKCIDGETSDQLQMQALRVAVMDQIIGFKQSQLLSARPITCPETGEQLSWQHCHVDHCAPDTFERLVADWLLSEGITIEQVAISPSRDISFHRKLTNEAQRQSWWNFHNSRKRLRLLSPFANLSIAKRKTGDLL
jgi:hypothetical protein